MKACIAKKDHRYLAALSAGLLHDRKTIEKRFPDGADSAPPDYRKHSTRDALAARQYTSLCRACTIRDARELTASEASSSPNDLCSVLDVLPMKVWVIGPSQDRKSVFEPWFEQAGDPNYRILVRANPTLFKGFSIVPHWSIPVASSPFRKTCQISQKQLEQSARFLEALVKLLPFGDEFVTDFLTRIGHEYSYADTTNCNQ